MLGWAVLTTAATFEDRRAALGDRVVASLGRVTISLDQWAVAGGGGGRTMLANGSGVPGRGLVSGRARKHGKPSSQYRGRCRPSNVNLLTCLNWSDGWAMGSSSRWI